MWPWVSESHPWLTSPDWTQDWQADGKCTLVFNETANNQGCRSLWVCGTVVEISKCIFFWHVECHRQNVIEFNLCTSNVRRLYGCYLQTSANYTLTGWIDATVDKRKTWFLVLELTLYISPPYLLLVVLIQKQEQCMYWPKMDCIWVKSLSVCCKNLTSKDSQSIRCHIISQYHTTIVKQHKTKTWIEPVSHAS